MKKVKEKLIVVAVILVVASILIFGVGFPYLTVDTITAKVTEKERIVSRSGDGVSSKYLIFTDRETLENTDCWRRLKFDSSDIYGALKEGGTYKFKVYGWRVPTLSWYRNVLDYEKVNVKKKAPPKEKNP